MNEYIREPLEADTQVEAPPPPPLVVACIGTSLSAYVYTWQSNQEVEEQIAIGRRRLWQRKGATRREMKKTSRDVLTGMIFSNIILYFVILATGMTLHPAGQTEIETAAQAAAALEPLAGEGATGYSRPVSSGWASFPFRS